MSTVDKINLALGHIRAVRLWGSPSPLGTEEPGCDDCSPEVAMEPQAAWGQFGAANEDVSHPPLVLAPSSLVERCKTGPIWTSGLPPSVAWVEMLCHRQWSDSMQLLGHKMFSCWLIPDLPGHVNLEEFPAICLSLKLIRCSRFLMVTTAAVPGLGLLQKKG